MSIKRARQLRKVMPPSEAVMWNALRSLKPFGLHFRRQMPLGHYYADFACHHPRLVLEIDGWTHNSPDYDTARDAFMRAEGYQVLRVSSDDVLHNVDGVVRMVLAATGRSTS
jgi:very-short-patch-repair endonuclease